MDLEESSIIPLPAQLEGTGLSFPLHPKTVIYYDQAHAEAERLANYLTEQIELLGGPTLVIEPADQAPGKHLYLSLDSEQATLGTEGYTLDIQERSVQVVAQEPAGLFYGIQTLLQLFPLESGEEENVWRIPTGKIQDAPVYAHRGSMLDVVRHFFDGETVQRYLDYLAHYKMNVLHLHLADDQGWRIEIDSWPNLTAIGGQTQVGGGPGGFFTQEEYATIVQYAADRFITIIPEIDMPGHTNAALASYPELNCNGIAPELYTGTGVGFSSLCIEKEITYQFVDDVIRELAAITPGPYIHIGGDEADATSEEDYIRFISRVQQIVSDHGKAMIGWDDIVAGEIAQTSVAQHWRHEENALLAQEKGMPVIISRASRTYLDMKYDSTTELGLHWAGYIEVDQGYDWDPATLVPGLQQEQILGVEAPLWAETIETLDDIEYLLFPRLPGYAEIGWTAAELRSWEEYRIRLAAHQPWMEFMEINYYRSPLVDWE
jgi:hexosaminidase